MHYSLAAVHLAPSGSQQPQHTEIPAAVGILLSRAAARQLRCCCVVRGVVREPLLQPEVVLLPGYTGPWVGLFIGVQMHQREQAATH